MIMENYLGQACNIGISRTGGGGKDSFG